MNTAMRLLAITFLTLTIMLALASSGSRFFGTPVGASTPCNYAGYDGHGSLVNTNITCGAGSGGAVTSVTSGPDNNINVAPTSGAVVLTMASDPTFSNIELGAIATSGPACYEVSKSFSVANCVNYDASYKGATLGVDGLTIASLASAPCIGTNSSGLFVSSVCPSPGPLNAGNCIGITNTPPPAVISYTCASPTPMPTPSMTAAGNIAFSGSWPYTATVTTPSPHAAGNIAYSSTWPYTATVSTPSPAATGCGVVSGSWPYTIDTTGCAAPSTLHAKLAIGLGFVAGTVATSATYPYQQVVGYTAGEITTIRAACGSADNGTTIFTVTDITSSTTIASATMSPATTTTISLATPYPLTAGHVLNMAINTAGTGSNCGFVAEGQQQAF